MKTSEKIDQIAAALAKAQASIEGAKKDGQGNYGRYVTLASVVDACKGPLLDNGIGFVQTFEPTEPGRLCLTTTLLHTSGQFISGTMAMPLPKQDPQGFGSATTYARRFGLAAMVGVCPEDDDGAGASGPPQRQQSRQRPAYRSEQKPAPSVNKATGEALATPEQVAEIKDLLTIVRLPEGTVDKWFAKQGVDRWEQMPADVVGKCIQFVETKLPKAVAQ